MQLQQQQQREEEDNRQSNVTRQSELDTGNAGASVKDIAKNLNFTGFLGKSREQVLLEKKQREQEE